MIDALATEVENKNDLEVRRERRGALLLGLQVLALLAGVAWSFEVTAADLMLAALSSQNGTGGVDPFLSCADDGICNAAVCKSLADPDCVPENCNSDGRCVATCANDPDCLQGNPVPAHDERILVQDPARVPFKAITKVDIGPDGGGRGSAVLVGPCTFLTNGHVVYNRVKDKFRAIQKVHPGSYYDEGKGKAVDPYGSKPPSLLATNTSWEHTGEQQYDYGAIFIDSPFTDIEPTLIPVVFEYEPGFVNLSGYPSERLPSDANGAKQEQWRGWGAVTTIEDRLVYYDARSTGGASGSPVWVYNATADDRKLVAINRAHTGASGIGVRMVGANQGLITKWMNQGCALAGEYGARKKSLSSLTRDRLTLRGEPIAVQTPAALGLVAAPIVEPGNTRVRTVAQWIEGEFYLWEEHLVSAVAPNEVADNGDPAAQTGTPASTHRYLRLLQPEKRALDPDEAAVLLSASNLWQRATVPPRNPVYYAPPTEVHAVLPEDAPRRDGPAGPEREITGRP